jgi:hypothetical protein
MNFDVSPFNRVKPVTFRLAAWKKDGPPAQREGENALRTVIKFARFVGLASIPATASEKLKADPYYKYCFYRIKCWSTVYSPDEFSVPVRARMKTILEQPGLYNDEDLSQGLRSYLNNFLLMRFPGTRSYQTFKKEPSKSPHNAPVYLAIDRFLGEQGRLKAVSMCREAEAEKVEGELIRLEKSLGDTTQTEKFEKRAAYAKLSLDVFNALVASGQFTPQQLWT